MFTMGQIDRIISLFERYVIAHEKSYELSREGWEWNKAQSEQTNMMNEDMTKYLQNVAMSQAEIAKKMHTHE